MFLRRDAALRSAIPDSMETKENNLAPETILGLLLGIFVTFVGIKARPTRIACSRFKNRMNSHGRIVPNDERYARLLGDIIYRDAQGYRIPIDRENIKVEMERATQE
jgi:hypothetical protein